MTTFAQRAAAELDAEANLELRQKIARLGRPAFGTSRMRRHARCILIAAVVMTRPTVPPGSVLIIADAFGSWQDSAHPAVRNRRCWIDLGGSWSGTSWEPVQCTTLPTPRHWQICDPRNVERYHDAGELRAAMREAGWQPGGGKANLYRSLNKMINSGRPLSGEFLYPGDDGYEPPPHGLPPEPLGRARPRKTGPRFNGLTPDQLAEAVASPRP